MDDGHNFFIVCLYTHPQTPMESSHPSSYNRAEIEEGNEFSSDNGSQSVMVNVGLAKQSLLQNPQSVNNPNLFRLDDTNQDASSSRRLLGTQKTNQSNQSFRGSNLQFPSQQIGHGQQMMQNLNGNNPANITSSFPFFLDPSSLHLDQNSQQGSITSDSIEKQLQLKHLLYNMQPNQIFSSSLNSHTLWNNQLSEIGMKRKLNLVDMNASIKKMTEEDQSYQAVSANSSSGTSVAFMSNNHLSAPFQNQPMFVSGKNISNENKDATDEKDSAKKSRNERNQREQVRAQRLNQRIKDLRSVLNEANVTYKQNKYSILVNVVGYIKQLQSRSQEAEIEHKRLFRTIRQAIDTTKNDGFVHHTDSDIDVGNDTPMLRAKGLDYRLVFEQCKFPLAVTAIDGRFLFFNSQFKDILGLNTDQIEHKTLFDFISGSAAESFFATVSTLLDETNGKRKNATRPTDRSTVRHHQSSSRDDENKSGDSSGDKDSDGCSGGETSGRKSESTISSANGKDGSDGDTQSQSKTTQSIHFWSTPLSRPNENVSADFVFHTMDQLCFFAQNITHESICGCCSWQ
jgi:PAS domain S-box-containing protein